MRHIAEIRNFGDRGSTQNLEALLFCFYNSGTLFLKMFLPGAEGAQKLTLSRFRGPFGDLFGVILGSYGVKMKIEMSKIINYDIIYPF